MEQDVNVIIDVECEEAQTLIDLAELLFEEWYIARNTCEERIKAIAAVGVAKKALQEQGKLEKSDQPQLPKPNNSNQERR